MIPKPLTAKLQLVTFLTCLTISLIISGASTASSTAPQDIPDSLSCGKCGMFPAKYPQWQTQIIFTDGSMSAFDGCKCMFGFMMNMGEYDTTHQKTDIAQIWVRDFKSGEWTDAKTAHYIIGSDVMGPMGKELIPFQNQGDADSFQKEHGGHKAEYSAINVATLKPLMGKMHMKKEMNMEGHVK